MNSAARCPGECCPGGGMTVLQQDADHAVYRLDDTDGEAVVTVYPVFPGIEIGYYDIHAGRCSARPAAGRMEISHCLEGRIEYPYGEDYVFLAPGDLSVMIRDASSRPLSFPTGHYHGITVSIDPERTPRCLSCFLEDVEVRPAALMEKFCGGGAYFVARSSVSVAHLFSELYSVPEDIRKGYLKVKILELLLFLSTYPVDAGARQPSYTRTQVRLAEEVSRYLLANTDSRCTVSELADRFGVSVSQIAASFRGVYGMSTAAFQRAQKMHGAARLLRTTDRTVLDIAGQFGYDNGSKFAKAFRDVIGVSPNAYRNGLDWDSCAPDAGPADRA